MIIKDIYGYQGTVQREGGIEPIVIRVISDNNGETISLQGNGFLIGCKVADIEEVIREARRERP